MDDLDDSPAAPLMARWPMAYRWALLIALSLVLTVLLELARLPAALLLGPMIAGVILGAFESGIRVPGAIFLFASSVIGCLMARSLPPSVFVELVRDWPIYVIGIGAVIAVAALLGIILTRLQVLPGTSAIWGSAPGGASAMVIMADAFGADARLVAFMAYLRVALVALIASIVARTFSAGGGEMPAMDWFPPIDVLAFGITLAIIVAGVIVGKLGRVPAGGMLVPMILGVVLQASTDISIELPPVLLTACYAVVGWTIGLRFTLPTLRYAAKALPAALGSILALIAICGLFAMLLVQFAGIDPLTAYLATSPGGADSVAIIAANSPVNVPFVMAMQAGRLIVVILTGPIIARWIATRPWIEAMARPRQG